MNPVLPTLPELIALERGFFRAITHCQPRTWGEIARNDQNPDSHDSNHTYISGALTSEQFSQVLDEVEAFYRDAPASPRVRYYTACMPADLLKIAEKQGWQTRLEESTWRAWLASSVPAAAPHIPGLTIHQPITSEEIEACHLVRQEDESAESHSRQRQTWEHLIRSANVTPLLARIDGEPAAVLAVVWLDRWGDVEEVKTRLRFRQRGICTALRFAQSMAIERQSNGLILYDIEEGPDRVYARAGFQLIGKTQCAMASRQ